MRVLKILFLAIGLCMPFTGVYAQTKKSGTRTQTSSAAKKTTATAKKSTAGTKKAAVSSASSKKTSTGGALTKSKLIGKKYIGYVSGGLEALGDNIGFFIKDEFKENDVYIDLLGNVGEKPWNLVGNSITFSLGQVTFKLTSNNGGKTLTGSAGALGKINLYSVTTSPLDSIAFKKDFNNGAFNFYLQLYSSKGELGCPVNVKISPNEDGTGGTYKIASDNTLLTSLGVLKGDYIFTDDSIEFSSKLSDEANKAYQIGFSEDDPEEINGYNTFMTVNLGKTNIPDFGYVDVLLHMVKK